MELLDPMLGFVFRALFASEDKTSKFLLIEFLNDVLIPSGEERIREITYLNPFNEQELVGDVLKIGAVADKGELINIQLQIDSEDVYEKGAFYCWANAYVESVEDVNDDDSFKKTILISIMNEPVVKGTKRFHTHFQLRERKRHCLFTDTMQIHFLELAKFPHKEIEELKGLELWLSFLKESAGKGNQARREKLKGKSETMKMVLEKLETISADERMWAAAVLKR